MRLSCLGLVLACVTAAACTAGSGDSGRRDGSIGFDARLDAARDAGPVRCATDEECDDGFDCTLDGCGVGGVCDNAPLDALCADGERCSPATGCTTGCATDADCNDGIFCNGTETCLREMCYPGTAADCDDGNACTVDTCDMAFDGCRYEVAEGCDAGIPPADSGVPCDPFDPGTHYAGAFRFLPVQASSCLSATYSVDDLTFSTSGGTLSVVADRFTLTESPVPSGATFHVTYTQSDCAVYELEGTFSCADRFSGTWRATMMGSCSICSNQNASVVGIRR